MPKNPSANMYKEEIIAILRLLDNRATVFEWGSGQSTILFSQWCREYISVEDGGPWMEKVKRALVTDNVILLHRPEVTKIETYINAIDAYGKFDFILVDGMERVRCAERARTHLNPDGRLLIHDWDRPLYRPMLDWYEEESRVENLGILRLKCAG